MPEFCPAAPVLPAELHFGDAGRSASAQVPDEEWGERVAAMVALRPGSSVDPDELRDWVRERLGSLKTPDVIAVRDELPHTATGKILRRQIRTELTA